jgi:hypothetical protein
VARAPRKRRRVTVAFIGDQGLRRRRGRSTTDLTEGTDAVLPAVTSTMPTTLVWNAQIDSILGVDFPFIPSRESRDNTTARRLPGSSPHDEKRES